MEVMRYLSSPTRLPAVSHTQWWVGTESLCLESTFTMALSHLAIDCIGASTYQHCSINAGSTWAGCTATRVGHVISHTCTGVVPCTLVKDMLWWRYCLACTAIMPLNAVYYLTLNIGPTSSHSKLSCTRLQHMHMPAGWSLSGVCM